MILGVLSAEHASSGPVLGPILGRPLLARQLERLGRSRRMDALVVVTGIEGADDAVAALCGSLQMPCFRSGKDSALDRVYEASRQLAPGHVVCLDARHPLTDPALMDEVIGEHLDGDLDLTSTFPPLSYPRGTEVTVLRLSCLEEAFAEAQPGQRRAVNRFFRAHPERFAMGSVSAESDYSEHRWVVEEPADLDLINRIYEMLYRENPDFSWRDVLELFEQNPDWAVRQSDPARDEDIGPDEPAHERSPDRGARRGT